MRYDDQDRESSNVEDRRGQGGGGMFRFPGGFGGGGRGGRRVRVPFPMGRGGGRSGGFSITTILIIGAILWFMGINPLKLIGMGGGGGLPDLGQMPKMPQFERQAAPNAERRTGGGFNLPGRDARNQSGRQARPDDALFSFTRKVLADTEDVWRIEFQRFGKRYEEPKMVIFERATRTGCGTGQAAMGPFYCPLDKTIYIDMSFYRELHTKFRAPGDFAQAYVIAHEVGHHIQKLLGIADRVLQLKRRHPSSANKIQVRMELQADCLAGVWANLNDQLKNRLEPGDIEEGLNAANAIGDDMIQRRQQGYVVPDSFTHGSAAQRVRWFRIGYKSGKMGSCDTFNAKQL